MKGMKRLAILGSTGSVGENALRIVRIHPDRFRVDALAVKKSVARLYEQAVEFRPKIVCIYDGVPAGAWLSDLKTRRPGRDGDKGLEEVATFPSVRQVVCAMVGAAGLKPIFAAVRARKMLAVANKEPLVMAGKLLLEEAAKHGVAVLPSTVNIRRSGNVWKAGTLFG